MTSFSSTGFLCLVPGHIAAVENVAKVGMWEVDPTSGAGLINQKKVYKQNINQPELTMETAFDAKLWSEPVVSPVLGAR